MSFRIRISNRGLGVGIGPLYVSGSSGRRRSQPVEPLTDGEAWALVILAAWLLVGGWPGWLFASAFTSLDGNPIGFVLLWMAASVVAAPLVVIAVVAALALAAVVLYCAGLLVWSIVAPTAESVRDYRRDHPSRRRIARGRKLAAKARLRSALLDDDPEGSEPAPTNAMRVAPGDLIVHDRFGFGIVTAVTYDHHQRAAVRFDSGEAREVDVAEEPLTVVQRV